MQAKDMVDAVIQLILDCSFSLFVIRTIKFLRSDMSESFQLSYLQNDTYFNEKTKSWKKECSVRGN